MKTTKFNFKAVFFTIFTAMALFLTACSDNNITGSSSGNNSSISEMPPDTGISIQVGRQVGFNFYLVSVVNNSRDTINDFHTQMLDSTQKFISPNTMNSGWQNTYGGNNHHDSSKVDLVTNRGLAYQPIKPGQQKQLLGFYMGWGSSTGAKQVKFNWHATKDGIVIASGTYIQ